MKIRYRLTSGPSQACVGDTGVETTDCSQISIGCDPVLSIRIVPPDAPELPYAFTCEPVLLVGRTLCDIASVDVPRPMSPVPEQLLEIQVAVFPRAAVTDPETGDLICPRVEFTPNGLPVTSVEPCTADASSCAPRPAFGGRAFYYPGDEETIVELGCTEPELLGAATCKHEEPVIVSAAVNDFDSAAGVADITADRLTVSIGEPKPAGDGYDLRPTDTFALQRLMIAPPAWSAMVNGFDPQSSVCLEVLEDTIGAPRTLTCRTPPNDPTRIDMTGWRLSKVTLDKILAALALTSFPPEGLVIGMVLDDVGRPQANAVVRVPTCEMPSQQPSCSIKYLSDDMTTVTTTATSSNGIFISEDAPYNSLFSWPPQPQPSFGGLVQGKVTIVILQEASINPM